MFCFVILHYKTEIDTSECIESILDKAGDCQIVVVDNASNNGSLESIQKKYRSTNIFYLKNKENLGFASGNNIGYQFAREKLKADYIAVINNDTLLMTNNFVIKVKKIYEQNKDCYVIGPDIISLIDDGHQNPMGINLLTKREARLEYYRYSLLLLLSKIGIYNYLKKGNSKKVNIINNYETETKNCILHGSFVIFTPSFIEMESKCFREGTFLYMEESILHLYLMRKKMQTIYCPQLKILHKEDSSTDSLFNAAKEKREFVFENMRKSIKVYQAYLEELGEINDGKV